MIWQHVIGYLETGMVRSNFVKRICYVLKLLRNWKGQGANKGCQQSQLCGFERVGVRYDKGRSREHKCTHIPPDAIAALRKYRPYLRHLWMEFKDIGDFGQALRSLSACQFSWRSEYVWEFAAISRPERSCAEVKIRIETDRPIKTNTQSWKSTATGRATLSPNEWELGAVLWLWHSHACWYFKVCRRRDSSLL